MEQPFDLVCRSWHSQKYDLAQWQAPPFNWNSDSSKYWISWIFFLALLSANVFFISPWQVFAPNSGYLEISTLKIPEKRHRHGIICTCFSPCPRSLTEPHTVLRLRLGFPLSFYLTPPVCSCSAARCYFIVAHTCSCELVILFSFSFRTLVVTHQRGHRAAIMTLSKMIGTLEQAWAAHELCPKKPPCEPTGFQCDRGLVKTLASCSRDVEAKASHLRHQLRCRK